jgi:hypothetical protein
MDHEGLHGTKEAHHGALEVQFGATEIQPVALEGKLLSHRGYPWRH